MMYEYELPAYDNGGYIVNSQQFMSSVYKLPKTCGFISSKTMTSTWICGFCVYEFDEIEGHKLVEQIPKSLESNFEDIKCHAFPESTVGSTVYQDDVTYSFRVRNEHSFQYATTYFKCRRDKRKSRGCIQRSLVLLSRFPFFSLFRKLLLEQIGPAFFQHGSSALEAAFTAISQWPDLNKVTSGNKISLPLFGSVLKFHAPERIQHENEIDDVSLYLMVGDTSLMWNLWEIMIAGEPLIVFGQTPEQCSEVVLSLVSIISPLISACDYRPYLSISSKVAGTIIRAHDAGDILPVVMGVTNQFWLKSLPRWPNVRNIFFHSYDFLFKILHTHKHYTRSSCWDNPNFCLKRKNQETFVLSKAIYLF